MTPVCSACCRRSGLLEADVGCFVRSVGGGSVCRPCGLRFCFGWQSGLPAGICRIAPDSYFRSLLPSVPAVCSCRLQRTIRFAVAVACFIRKKELPSTGKTPFVNGSSAEWLQVILAHGLQKPSSPAYISSGLRSVSVRVRDAGWGCYGYKKRVFLERKTLFHRFC